MIAEEYPMNVLEDAGLKPDDISDDVIWRLKKMIRSGVFGTERYRIYVTHYIEGLSETEIAEKLNINENKIKRELAQIRKILRKNMLNLAPGILQEPFEWLPPPELLYRNEDSFWDDELISSDVFFSIDSLEITVRSYNVMKRAGIKTVLDIERIGIEGLRSLKGIREKDIPDIVREVKKRFVVDI